MNRPVKIGTRGSPLALWQARTTARLLQERSGTDGELVIIRTSGDEPPDATLSGVGSRASGVDSRPQTSDARPSIPDARPPTPDSRPPTPDLNVKRMFVKEIEEALLDNRIDLAVHSAKDLSVVMPDGLRIGAALAREDPRDALVLPGGEIIADLDALEERLGPRPAIGTSSVRRAAQLAAVFPAATFLPIRGNVETRLRKLDSGACDALVLACAGLTRLGLGARISFALPVTLSVPAPGQGIVVVEIREDAEDVAAVVAAINDRDAMDALVAERTMVETLGGGCQLPVGAFAEVDGPDLVLFGTVMAPDGGRAVREHMGGARSDGAAIGHALGRLLLDQGAGEILRPR